MKMKEKAVISLKNIYKTYKMGGTEVQANRDVNIDIYAGEFVVIMGASGSGKSTLMNIIGCLDRPTSGTYFLDGEEVSKLDDNDLAKIRNEKIGFIFQKFHLLPGSTARENVELPMIYSGAHSAERKPVSAKFLRAVNLEDRMDHNPNELSGGQLQRVAIARSLVNNPSILLADEPTGNLDSKSGAEIMGLFQSLHRQGKTIILITHNPDMIKYGTRVIKLHDGNIVCDEPVEEITLADPNLEGRSVTGKITNGGRMNFFQSFKVAWIALKTNKLRSILTMLGIIIGVCAVIVMMSIGEGTKAHITSEISSLGSNLIFIQEGSRENVLKGQVDSSYRKLTMKDVEFIKEKCTLYKGVAPQISSSVTVRYYENNMVTTLVGTTKEFFHIRNFPVAYGRPFTDEELEERAPVCLLGSYVAEELFGEDVNPVGETLKVSLGSGSTDATPGIRFTIIGVLEEKGEEFGRNNDNQIVAPFDTVKYRIYYQKYIRTIFLEAVDSDTVEDTIEEVKTVLAPLHNNNKANIEVRSQQEILETIQSTLGAFTYMLAGIACISLLVGGIGIMNIMLVSVTERTKEIGLRKAIGARKNDILLQFLVEALVLSLSGGCIGILAGMGLAKIYGIIAASSSIGMLNKTYISMDAIMISFSFSAMVGIFFGLYPARKASDLDPIEALRHE